MTKADVICSDIFCKFNYKDEHENRHCSLSKIRLRLNMFNQAVCDSRALIAGARND